MFISQLSAHLDSSDINITFTKVGNVITAIVVPKPKNDKLSNLSPIVAKGTAEELDKNLVASLTSVFTAINEFKVSGVVEVVKEIEAAGEEPKAIEKPKAATKTPTVKAPTAKEQFDKASTLFKNAKYAEALPLYEEALKLKPDSKQYSEALKLCKRWVDSLKAADMFNGNVSVDPVQGNIAEVVIKEKETFQPFPSEEEVEEAELAQQELDEEEASIHETQPEIHASEDDDDFPI
jgi:PRTRC genetic system protein E